MYKREDFRPSIISEARIKKLLNNGWQRADLCNNETVYDMESRLMTGFYRPLKHVKIYNTSRFYRSGPWANQHRMVILYKRGEHK